MSMQDVNIERGLMSKVLVDSRHRAVLLLSQGKRWSRIICASGGHLATRKIPTEDLRDLEKLQYPASAVAQMFLAADSYKIAETTKAYLVAMSVAKEKEMSGDPIVINPRTFEVTRGVLVNSSTDLEQHFSKEGLDELHSKLHPNCTAKFRTKHDEAEHLFKAIAPEAPPEEPSFDKDTIGDLCSAAIIEGLNYEQTMERVLAKYPQAKTSKASWNWYKVQLRKRGLLEKKSRAVM